MTKQEQIEEIKQVLIKTYKRCISFEEDYMQTKYAEELYNAGYRKIAEDSVVLAKEEIEQLNKRNKELTSIAEYQQNSNMRRWKIIQEKEKEQFLLTCENCRLKKDIELLKYQKEQAVKEFAEKLKNYLEDNIVDAFGDVAVDVHYLTIDIDEFEEYIYELLKVYGGVGVKCESLNNIIILKNTKNI